jgi:hypothetical protein
VQVLVVKEKLPKLKQDTLSRFLVSSFQIAKQKYERKRKVLKPINTYVRILCENCIKNKDFDFAPHVINKEPLIFGKCENCGATKDLFLVTLKKNRHGPANNHVYNGLRTCGQCAHYEPSLKRCKIYSNLRFLSPVSSLARSCPYFTWLGKEEVE